MNGILKLKRKKKTKSIRTYHSKTVLSLTALIFTCKKMQLYHTVKATYIQFNVYFLGF